MGFDGNILRNRSVDMHHFPMLVSQPIERRAITKKFKESYPRQISIKKRNHFVWASLCLVKYHVQDDGFFICSLFGVKKYMLPAHSRASAKNTTVGRCFSAVVAIRPRQERICLPKAPRSSAVTNHERGYYPHFLSEFNFLLFSVSYAIELID